MAAPDDQPCDAIARGNRFLRDAMELMDSEQPQAHGAPDGSTALSRALVAESREAIARSRELLDRPVTALAPGNHGNLQLK